MQNSHRFSQHRPVSFWLIGIILLAFILVAYILSVQTIDIHVMNLHQRIQLSIDRQTAEIDSAGMQQFTKTERLRNVSVYLQAGDSVKTVFEFPDSLMRQDFATIKTDVDTSDFSWSVVFALPPNIRALSTLNTGEGTVSLYTLSAPAGLGIPYLALIILLMIILAAIIFHNTNKHNRLSQYAAAQSSRLISGFEQLDSAVFDSVDLPDEALERSDNFVKKVLALQKREQNLKVYLSTQVQSFVELCVPIIKGNFDYTLEFPPGYLSPIAKTINVILAKFRESIEEEPSAETQPHPEPSFDIHSFGEDTSTKTQPEFEQAPALKEDQSPAPTSAARDQVFYTEAQFSRMVMDFSYINKNILDFYEVLDAIYEIEINNWLKRKNYNEESIRQLEYLFDHKDNLIYALQKLNRQISDLSQTSSLNQLRLNKQAN
jgi:hypothetical protein